MKLRNDGRKRARGAIEAVSTRLIAFAAAAALAACATLSADSAIETKKAAVAKRVEARWASLIKGDVPGSYALLSPASKAVITEERYRTTIYRGLKKMEIDSIDCAAETCKVKVWITFDATPVKGHPVKDIRTTATETWVIDKGDYWYVWPN